MGIPRLFLWLLLVALSAPGATSYYVATNGSDSANGSLATPWLTVGKGISNCMAGDTLYVSQGIYPENITTKSNGTEGAYVSVVGSNAAVKTWTFAHAYNSVSGMTFSNGSAARVVYILNGAHWTRLDNCVVDADSRSKIYGVIWEVPTGIGDCGNAASHVLITNCTIKNIRSYIFLTIHGSSNLVTDCVFTNGNDGDFVNFFGKSNVVRNCRMVDMWTGAGENHPDVLGCWGNTSGIGYANQGFIFENNIVSNAPNTAFSQLTGNAQTNFGGMVIRNNLFVGVGNSGSMTIKDIVFYNNTFIDCCTNAAGFTLSPNFNWYDARLVSSGQVKDNIQYRVATTNGSVTYNGSTYTNQNAWTYSFIGTNGVSAFDVTGDALVYEKDPEYANGCRVYNNIFLGCGARSGANYQKNGWYRFDYVLTNVAADYNYVGTADYSPVYTNTEHHVIGGADGWNYYTWWEDHGINGGNPQFNGTGDYRLVAGSPLMAAGLTGLVSTDLAGTSRPNPPSIGAYESAVVTVKYVRPYFGTNYGAADGTSYSNAWSGIDKVSGLTNGDTLYVCGSHILRLTNYTSATMGYCTIPSGVTVLGYPSDKGWIFGGAVDCSTKVWNGPDANGVYFSTNRFAGNAKETPFQVDGTNIIRLKRKLTTTWAGDLGSHAFLNGTNFVKTLNGDPPSNNIAVALELGWALALKGNSNIVLKDLTFFSGGWQLDYPWDTTNIVANHIYVTNCNFLHGSGVSLYRYNDYWVFDGCTVSQSPFGIYGFGHASNDFFGPNNITINGCRISDIENAEYPDTDGHGIGARNVCGWMVTSNTLTGTGTGIEFYYDSGKTLKSNTVAWNDIRDTHVISGGTSGGGISFSGFSDLGNTVSNKIYGNLIVNAGTNATEESHGNGVSIGQCDPFDCYNNTLVNCWVGVMVAPQTQIGGRYLNNLISTPRGPFYMKFNGSNSMVNLACDYNLFYPLANTTTNFAFVPDGTHDANSVFASEPKLTATYRLGAASAAIGKGTNTGIGFLDIGAFPYVVGAGPSTVRAVTVRAGTVRAP